MELIDTHSHIDVAEFDADRADAVQRAGVAGVIAQIVPAIEQRTFAALADTCAQEPGLHPAYGLHPLLIADHRPSHLDDVREYLRAEACVAVGECGLDYYIEGLDADTQRFYFMEQLKLAREFDLPVIVHARRSVEEVIRHLRKFAGLTGVVHSFPGSEEQARQLWKLGFCLGIGGPVTYDRANRLRQLVASMPIEFLLLETDSPDQPDQWQRGQRNEPALMVRVAQVVAELRGVSIEEIACATSANARRLFGFGSPPNRPHGAI